MSHTASAIDRTGELDFRGIEFQKFSGKFAQKGIVSAIQ
jgi:hypothetical protein